MATTPAPYARRVCCTTFHDQPHRRDCTWKARSVAYNRELRTRLDANDRDRRRKILESWPRDWLVSECRERGLYVTGPKPMLVQRLVEVGAPDAV